MNLTLTPRVRYRCPNGLQGPNSDRHDAYNVPYAAIVPKRSTGGNLIVPVCFSASAVAYSSTRIETMFMGVGAAAGVAAKQIVERTAASVQEVNVTEVQRILTGTFNQIVHVPRQPPAPPSPGSSYTVSGAGSVQFNGQFIRSAGSQYKSTTCGNCTLYAYGGTWRLAITRLRAPNTLIYVAGEPSEAPPPTGWVVATGKAPAPTLRSAGSQTQGEIHHE